MSISIIIPVLDEEQALPDCLEALPVAADLEILVVDGGSSDRTVQIARAAGCRLLTAPPGRGSQQHAGALAATGELLVFLHGDTRLPHDFRPVIRQILQHDHVAAGAFQLAIRARGIGYRIIEQGANLRSRLLALPYGDQALFLRKTTYLAVGGFPRQPLLEDVALVGRLRKTGKIVIAPARVSTSARRWQQRGLLKTTLTNQLILAACHLGVAPERLARWYYGNQGTGKS